MHRVSVLVSGIALLLLACGASETIQDAGSADAGSQDAGSADAGSQDAGLADAGAVDASFMPDSTAVERLQAARQMVQRAVCECFMEPFSTVTECAEFGALPAADGCERNAYASHEAQVGEQQTCLAVAAEARVTCYAGAACSETMLADCDAAFASARASCPEPPMAAAQAFQAELEQCLREQVIGSGGTCPDGTDSVSTLGAAVFSGSTLRAGDDVTTPADCGLGDGAGGSPERVYRWRAATDGTYTFDTIGSSFDTVLYLLDDCAASSSIRCNDDADHLFDEPRSSVTVELTAEQTVLVVVEGFDLGSVGDFVVNITAGAP